MEQQSKEVTKESSRYEQKRLEREQKERKRVKSLRSKKIKNYGIGAVVFVLVIGGIGTWIRSVNKKETVSRGSLQGKRFDDQGREHVKTVDVSKYNSVPPTSGPHYDSQTNWGVHKEQLPEGYQIHNLEHGGILIQYKPDLAPGIVEKLKAVGESYEWKKIILAPYQKLEQNIALSAWTWLDTLDNFDEARIRAFIDAHRNRGPENVPDNMASVKLP